MNNLFVISLLVSAVGWRYAFTRRREILFDLTEACFFAITLYALTLACALPWVAINAWSLERECLTLIISGLFPIYVAGRRAIAGNLKFALPQFSWGIVLFAGAIALGIALQWNGIYYFYATHDPSAYLNAAHYIARTGAFTHSNDVIAEAYGKGHDLLRPLLNVIDAPEPWQLTRNFGVVPKEISRGVGSFHGLFGAPLFLAIGIKLFGESLCLRIHWLHLFTSCLLMVAIAQALTRQGSIWPWIAPLLFVISPLVPLVFREPLSEPLAEVFFLGMVFSTLKMVSRSPQFGRYAFALCLLGALCTRVSGLMYLPFVFLTILWVPWEQATRRQATIFYLFIGVSVVTAVALIYRLSPSYISDTLKFYSDTILTKISPDLSLSSIPPVAWAALAALAFVPVFLLRNFLANLGRWALTKGWRTCWVFYFSLLTAGLIFRYGKLVTRLTHNFGGYPFVLFNFDSLLFYGCPLLVLLGIYYWFKTLSKIPHREFAFLHTYVPFCFFFYSVFRFLPLNVQVNFQRYLLIELLPLSVIGAVIVLRKMYSSRGMFKATARLYIVFIALWTGTMTYALNRPDIAETALSAYGEIRAKLKTLYHNGEKPVIVAVSPTWLNVAYLLPLSHGFGYPVVFINEPFSFRASSGISELINDGYSPIMAIDSSLMRGEASLEEGGREWKRWTIWNDCYQYSKFGLGAPPLELDKKCNSMVWLRPSPAPERSSHPDRIFESAWIHRGASLPISLKHWFGWKIWGPSACAANRNDSPSGFSASFLFDPETDYHAPQLTLNGEPHPERVKSILVGKSRSRSSYRVEVNIPLMTLDCRSWNTVDFYFPPHPELGTPRHATLLSAKLDRITSDETLP